MKKSKPRVSIAFNTGERNVVLPPDDAKGTAPRLDKKKTEETNTEEEEEALEKEAPRKEPNKEKKKRTK